MLFMFIFWLLSAAYAQDPNANLVVEEERGEGEEEQPRQLQSDAWVGGRWTFWATP